MKERHGSAVVGIGAMCLLLMVIVSGIDAPRAFANSRSFCRPDRPVRTFDSVVGPGEVGLVGGQRPVMAGRTPAFRVVNDGSAEVAVGDERTRRRVNGRWVEMRPPPGVVSGWQSTLVPPKEVSRCMGPTTWPKWPAGKYQWLLGVRNIGKDGFGRKHFLHATFVVRH